ncbi:MAG: hypothetical protein RR646_04885 [Erysipelotrichaceae bacterium]
MKITNKLYFIIGLLTTILLLTICAIFVYVSDPKLQYHPIDTMLNHTMKKDMYYYFNAGIAKNEEYDTIITGSSMTRPMHPSYIDDKLNVKSVKLSMAGAYGKDIKNITELALKNQPIKKAIISLDYFGYTVDKDEVHTGYPAYLYNNSILDDSEYLLSMEFILNGHQTILDTKKGIKTTTLDDYQNYALEDKFNAEQVIKIANSEEVKTKQKEKEIDQFINKTFYDNVQQNLIELVENNPNVKFEFFIPPVSMASHYKEINQGNEKGNFAMIEYIVSKLIQYPNVNIHFIQEDKTIITNYNNYTDTIHYNMEVANTIIDYISNNKYKLSKEDYKQRIKEFEEYALTYDYNKDYN